MSDRQVSLPDGWAQATVGDVAEYINGLAFNAKVWVSSGRPIIRIQNLTGSSTVVNYTAENFPQDFIVPTGTILVSWSATLDVFIWNGPEGVLNQHIFKVVPDERVVDPGFLFWALKYTIRDMRDSANLHGSTMKHINRGPFLSHPLLIPPLAEQRKIAARMEDLHARSGRAREIVAALPELMERFRQSVLASAFRGDLTADWRASHPDAGAESASTRRTHLHELRRRQGDNVERLARRKYAEPQMASVLGLADLPDGWMWVTFDELAWNLRSGTAKTAVRTTTEWPVLRSSAVRPGSIDFEDRNHLPAAPVLDDTVRNGDLLITRLSGSLEFVGNCAMVRGLDHECIAYPDRLFRARLVEGVCAEYIEYAFAAQSLRGDLLEAAKSSAGHQRISMGDLKMFLIPLPSRSEQQLIASRLGHVLSRANQVAGAVTEVYQNLDAAEKSILTKAFRGKLVPQDPNDEPASVLLERIKEERARQPAKRRGRHAQLDLADTQR